MIELTSWRCLPLSGEAGHKMVKLAIWQGWPQAGYAGHQIVKLATWRDWPLATIWLLSGEAGLYLAILARFGDYQTSWL
jgi:hypothetical protein